MTNHEQINPTNEQAPTHDYESELAMERRALGLEMHQANMAIYLGRQALKELRQQQPPDEVAIAEQYSSVKAAHSKRHELGRSLAAVKDEQDRQASLAWPGYTWMQG